MEVLVLHTEACPHVDLARQRIAEALATVGTEAVVSTVVVATPAEAQRWAFAGSPTILVDGRDPFPAPDRPAALTCRLYQTDEGLQGAPAVTQLVEVLAR